MTNPKRHHILGLHQNTYLLDGFAAAIAAMRIL
jgi:hypothetical protein